MSTSVAGELQVIVVDDDDAVARQLCLGLEIQGFQVVVAHSMDEALGVLSQSPEIGVVMTDIRMPGGSGLELAQAVLDSRVGVAATEVVIITGHATMDDATAALRFGAADFLPKPFRLSEAVDAVRKAAGRASRRRAEATEVSIGREALSQSLHEREVLRQDLAKAELRFLNLPAEAIQADEDFDQMRAAVSHALRTPMNAISGGAALISDDADPTNKEVSMQLLHTGVDNAVVAIELVEELNRLKQGEQVAMNAFDVAAYVHDLAAASVRDGAIAPACLSPLGDNPMIVVASPLRIRRAIALCFGAASDWANAGSSLHYDVHIEEDGGGHFACFTVVVSPTRQLATPPAGSSFGKTSGFLSRTQESLRFLIARRLVAHCGGIVSSWSGPPGMTAIRMALPLRGVQ